ncbi:MAG: ComEC/Rec2 family competence protein [Bacilli bacterium]
MIRLRILLLYDIIYYLLFLIVLIYALVCNKYEDISVFPNQTREIIGIVNSIKLIDNKYQLEIKSKEKIIAYIETDNLIENGYKIKLIGEISNIASVRNKNVFNYKNYVYNKGIYRIFYADEIEILSKRISILYKLKNFIIFKINSNKYIYHYLSAFVLGEKHLINNEVYTSYSTNGVNHLFAVSGMHVALLIGIITFTLKKLNFSESKRLIINTLIILIYIFLTNFTESLLRAGLFFILLSVNKLFYFHIKNINLLLLTFSILVIFNSYIIYSMSFQFSFIITLFLILSSEFISKSKLKLLLVSLISFLVSVPIMLYYFFQLNILSVLYNLFFVPFVSILIFPLSIASLFIPILGIVVLFLINILESISLFLSKVDIFIFIISKPSLIFIFIYYILALLFIKKQKLIFIIPLLLMILIQGNLKYLDSSAKIVMLDIGQGDSILIKLPNNMGNILVDTGGKFGKTINSDNNYYSIFEIYWYNKFRLFNY